MSAVGKDLTHIQSVKKVQQLRLIAVMGKLQPAACRVYLCSPQSHIHSCMALSISTIAGILDYGHTYKDKKNIMLNETTILIIFLRIN